MATPYVIGRFLSFTTALRVQPLDKGVTFLTLLTALDVSSSPPSALPAAAYRVEVDGGLLCGICIPIFEPAATECGDF